MSIIKFENEIVDLLLCPKAQDDFKHWKLENLLLEIADKVYIDQIEDSYSLAIIANMYAKLENAHEYETVMEKLKKQAISEGRCIIFI